jgi:hypothetical protein
VILYQRLVILLECEIMWEWVYVKFGLNHKGLKPLGRHGVTGELIRLDVD